MGLPGRGTAAYEDDEGSTDMFALVMGWIGTVGTIWAYVLLSRGQVDATSLRYSALNLVAGVLAGTASALYGAWPSVGANVVWCAIALHSAVTTLHRRRSHSRLALATA
jgi:hypothetical protein